MYKCVQNIGRRLIRRSEIELNNEAVNNPKYVLFTPDEKYVVEYLLRQLVLSESITEALTFDDEVTAIGFKKMLVDDCELECSVNTYIE